MDNKISEKEFLLENIRQELNNMSKEDLEKVKVLVSDLETDKAQEQF